MNSGDKMRTMTPFKLTNEELSASIAKRFHGKCGYDFCQKEMEVIYSEINSISVDKS